MNTFLLSKSAAQIPTIAPEKPAINSLATILFNAETFENNNNITDVEVFMVDDDDYEIDDRLLNCNQTLKMTKGQRVCIPTQDNTRLSLQN